MIDNDDLAIVPIITDLKSITLVPTPVRISSWGRNGREERTEERLKAKLFDGPPRPATLITRNAYGDPFVMIGRLRRAEIGPDAQYPHMLDISIAEQKRGAVSFQREFPKDPVILMWGRHDIALDNLPPCLDFVRSRCASFVPTWHEVARRCHAVAPGDVWLDTTAAAVAANDAWRAKKVPTPKTTSGRSNHND